jgi:hypothetical protein
MLSEVSAVVPAIYMCLSDGGVVSSPNASEDNGLCNLSTNYGKWPSNMDDFEDYVTSDSDSFSDDNWYFYLEGNGARVCCNANMSGCEKLASGSPCNANNP